MESNWRYDAWNYGGFYGPLILAARLLTPLSGFTWVTLEVVNGIRLKGFFVLDTELERFTLASTAVPDDDPFPFGLLVYPD